MRSFTVIMIILQIIIIVALAIIILSARNIKETVQNQSNQSVVLYKKLSNKK